MSDQPHSRQHERDFDERLAFRNRLDPVADVEPQLAIGSDRPDHTKYDSWMPVIRWTLNVRSQAAGYATALAIPMGITYAVAWLGWPAFIFEHLVVLLVVVIAVPYGVGPAIVAAATSVVADNVLLREPLGSPTLTGYRDVVDLLLFAAVAVVISELVRRAHAARVVAELAAQRERRTREDRDRLIATVTHDLATPLSVLSGTVQFVKRHGSSSEADLSRLLRRLDSKPPVHVRRHWSERSPTRRRSSLESSHSGPTSTTCEHS